MGRRRNVDGGDDVRNYDSRSAAARVAPIHIHVHRQHDYRRPPRPTCQTRLSCLRPHMTMPSHRHQATSTMNPMLTSTLQGCTQGGLSPPIVRCGSLPTSPNSHPCHDRRDPQSCMHVYTCTHEPFMYACIYEIYFTCIHEFSCMHVSIHVSDA